MIQIHFGKSEPRKFSTRGLQALAPWLRSLQVWELSENPELLLPTSQQ